MSPPPLVDAAAREAIDALGDVAWVVVPNSFHYLYAREFGEHYPAARLFAAPGLAARVPELEIDSEYDGSLPEKWGGEIEAVALGPVRGLSELLLFHVASRTLLLTDVAFHMRRYPRAIDRVLWRLAGLPAGFGPGRTSRAMLLADRDVAREALSRALAWPFERIVVAHGDVIDQAAKERFRSAFAAYL